MTLTPLPRSVRNNNPGNIKRSGIQWAGLAADQSDPVFCTFRTPALGFRALAMDLKTKYGRGLNTVRKILEVYAPPPENDTDAYVRSVCDCIGIGPDACLNLGNESQLMAMCRAIATHEAGGWFFEAADLQIGVEMTAGLLV